MVNSLVVLAEVGRWVGTVEEAVEVRPVVVRVRVEVREDDSILLVEFLISFLSSPGLAAVVVLGPG